MIIQKSLINHINNLYFSYMKNNYKLLKNNSPQEILITTLTIANSKINFLLKFVKNDSDNEFLINAGYLPTQIKRKYNIFINININKDFNEIYFNELHLAIKADLVHEIEHHLQRRRVAHREKISIKAYKNAEKTIECDREYINDLSEIEAYTKDIYFTHRKSKIPFNNLLDRYANAITINESLRKNFKNNIYNFIRRRKDLNIITNIKF